jgi:hypothetical protein
MNRNRPSTPAIVYDGHVSTEVRLPFDTEHLPDVLVIFGVVYRAVIAINGVARYHLAPEHLLYYVKREDLGPEYKP